jgi:YVTN family beta-propeller protein
MKTYAVLLAVMVVLSAMAGVVSSGGGLSLMHNPLIPSPLGHAGAGGTHGVSGPIPVSGSNDTVGTKAPGSSPPAGSPTGTQTNTSISAFGPGRSDNTVIATISVGNSPGSTCSDGINGNVYVGDSSSNSVNVIDGKTRTAMASLAVGSGPGAIDCNGPNGDIFVANSGSNNVSIIDGATNTVVGSFAAGLSPDGITFDPVTGEAFVADSGSNTVLSINVTTGGVTGTMKVGSSPAGIIYGAGDAYVGENPNGYIYVANYGGTTVTVISPTTHSVVGTIVVGSKPDGLAFDPVYYDLYVSNSGSNTVSVISATTNMVIDTIPVGKTPEGMTWDQDTGSIYVANANSNTISTIAGDSNKNQYTIPVGSGPRDAAVDVKTGQLYVVNGNSNSVSVVSVPDNSVVIVTFRVPQNYPEPIGYDSANGDVYVLDEAGDTVDVIASMGLFTNTIIAIVTVGNNPCALAVNAAYGEDGILYVADAGSNAVSVISGASNTVVATVGVGSDPRGIAYDSDNGYVYVNDEGSGTASVINGKTNTVIGTIPSVNGAGEHTSAQYDTSNGLVYMCASGGVSVIDPTTNTVIKRITGMSPYTMGYDPGSGNMYVTSAGSSVWVVSGATNTIAATISGPFSSSEGITYDTANGYLYMGDEDGGNTMWIINGATNTVVTYLNVGVLADGTVFDNVDGDNYVANEQSQSVSVIATIFMTSVAITPASSTIPTGGMQTLKATPTCTGGPCPTGITYSWSMSPGNYGTLNPPNSPSTTFVAGSTPGTVTFTVTATMNNAPITSAPITVKIIPGLNSVSVKPSASIVFPGGTQNFTATPVCTGGPCPSGATYSWFLNNSMGNLSTSVGATTLFTAGMTEGYLLLTVTATLNGNIVTQFVNITIIPALTKVFVNPTYSILPTGVTETFTATIVCIGGACPSVVAYRWILNNSLGTLSASTGPQVNFTAGSSVGDVNLVANVTLSGLQRQSSPVPITIIPGLSSVVVNPDPAIVPLNWSRPFTANISCTGGPCPAGATYLWMLSAGLGTLNTTAGTRVDFTAGSRLANISLSVNVTLDSVKVTTIVPISIVPALTAVTVQPSPAYISPDDSLQFFATLWCNGGPCPSGAMYGWSLNNSLGFISGKYTTATITFTAGPDTGLTGLSLSVYLDGITQKSPTTNITITTGPTGIMISSLDITPYPAKVGQNMSIAVAVTGGSPKYSYTYSGLPPGCDTVNENPLSCIPRSPGNYSITVVVKDSAGMSAKASALIDIIGTIKPLNARLTCNVPSITAGIDFELSANVTGGTGPFLYVWSLDGKNNSAAPDAPIWWTYLPNPGIFVFRAWIIDSQGTVARSGTVNITVTPVVQINSPTSPTTSYWWLVALAFAVCLLLFAAFAYRRRVKSAGESPAEDESAALPFTTTLAPEDALVAEPVTESLAPAAYPGPGTGQQYDTGQQFDSGQQFDAGQPPMEMAPTATPEAAPTMYCTSCGAPLGPDLVCTSCGLALFGNANEQQQPAAEQPPPAPVQQPPMEEWTSPKAEALRQWLESQPPPQAPSPPPLAPPDTTSGAPALPPWEVPLVTKPEPEARQPPAPPPADQSEETSETRTCALCGGLLQGSYCPKCNFNWG